MIIWEKTRQKQFLQNPGPLDSLCSYVRPPGKLGVQRPGGRAETFVQMPEGPREGGGGAATGQNDSRIRVHTNFQLATTNSLISITVVRLLDRPKVFRLDLNEMYNDIHTVQHVQLMQFVESCDTTCML